MGLMTFPFQSNQPDSVAYQFSVIDSPLALTRGYTDGTVTNPGTGQYTITFNRAFPAADYLFIAQSLGNDLKVTNVTKAVGSVSFEVTDDSGTLTDGNVDVLVIGSQVQSRKL